MIEITIIVWAFITALILKWISSSPKKSVYFYGGFLLIAIGFLSSFLLYSNVVGQPNQFHDLAIQLVLMCSAVLGANFFSHAIINSNANKEK